jgi:hypothetical protein
VASLERDNGAPILIMRVSKSSLSHPSEIREAVMAADDLTANPTFGEEHSRYEQAPIRVTLAEVV